MSVPHVVVLRVSGEPLAVIGEAEARWWNQARDQYLAQTRFTEVTDLADLDRLLIQELMIFRWSDHLARGLDYEGFPIDEDKIRKNLRDYSEQISRLKDNMGLTKKVRDQAANEGDFSQWIANLKARARQFGVHREEQVQKALVLMNELSSIVTTYDRCDAEERAKLGFETEGEIMAWVRSTMLPEFKDIDAKFRAGTQKYWHMGGAA